MGPHTAAILAASLAALSLVSGVYYTVILARIVRARGWLPTLREFHERAPHPHIRPTGGGGIVCVIIPAHNESQNIAAVVRSVLAQDIPDLRLVIVLDRCTDDTRAVAEDAAQGDARLEIIENQQPRQGWTGKNNALRIGAEESRAARDADHLLFIDADVTLAPHAIRAALALARERNLDLLSLMTTLTRDRWFERIVQPAACFELGRLFPLDRVNRAESPRALANGQFMLFRREAYEAIGGHHRVADELLEDIALARLMRRRKVNRRFGVFMADAMVECRMYRDYPAFVRGWKRIYAETLARRLARLRRAAWRIRIIDIICPAAALAAVITALVASRTHLIVGIAAAALGAVSLTSFLSVLTIAYRKQHLPLRYLPLYPLGAWITSRILLAAAHDLRQGKPTAWAGMTYAREAR